jgi:methyl-accepting chemotaxis protein
MHVPKEMTIRSKMIATLSIVAILLLTMTLTVNYQIDRYGELKKIQTTVVRLIADIGDLRKYEKDFLHRKQADYVEQFSSKHSETDAEISRLIDALNGHGIDTAELAKVQSEVQDYTHKFEALARFQTEIGLNADTGLYGKLRDAVHEAEAVLNETSNHELLTDMLMLRRHEKDFMLRRKMHYVEAFQQQFDNMQTALSSTYLSDSQRSKTLQLMQRYRTDFLALVKAEQQIGLTQQEGLLGELRQTIHGVEEHLAKLFTTVNKTIEQIHVRLEWTLFTAVAFIALSIAGLLSVLGINILRRIRNASDNMQQIAAGDGDLTRRLEERGSDEISELARSFNLFANKIHDTLKKSAELVNHLGQTGDRVTDAASTTDCSMKQLRSNTHSVVTATEEMSATARDVANNASQVSTATQQANALSTEGRHIVEQSIQSINSFADEFNEAATTITSLRSETDNIGSILDVIRSIAEQTNLLALNAAIEAARAGEQGRGFAVVADEVRNLAHRSQESTNEIQELIERLQSQAESAASKIQHGHQRISDTVTKARQAGVALSKITESVGSISDMTTQIATAAEEQSMVVAEINQNVVTIEQLAGDTAQNADLTTHLTTELAEAMASLIYEIRHFHFTNDEQLVLAQAKTAHLAWKARLRDFLDGKSHLKQEQAISHHQCDLGKWYDGEGRARFGHLSEFQAIAQPHEQIHNLIKQVISLKGKGDQRGAEATFNDVTRLSEQIIKRIDELAQALN